MLDPLHHRLQQHSLDCGQPGYLLVAQGQQTPQRLPPISMSIGPKDTMTRLVGWTFGSAQTFAVSTSSSTPGQVSIEYLYTVLAILQKTIVGK